MVGVCVIVTPHLMMQKAQGYAGFPALLLDDDRVILDEAKLKEIF